VEKKRAFSKVIRITVKNLFLLYTKDKGIQMRSFAQIYPI